MPIYNFIFHHLTSERLSPVNSNNCKTKEMLSYGYRNYAVKTAAQVQKPEVLCTGFEVTRKYAYISSESITVNIVGGGEGAAVVCVQALVNLEPHLSVYLSICLFICLSIYLSISPCGFQCYVQNWNKPWNVKSRSVKRWQQCPSARTKSFQFRCQIAAKVFHKLCIILTNWYTATQVRCHSVRREGVW